MDHLTNGDGRPSPATLEAGSDSQIVIALPEPGVSLAQDEEWCIVRIGDEPWREVRFHDYHEVYEVEGLYEHLFYKTLGCNSPEVIVGRLERQLAAAGVEARDLRVLDLGAGNGMVAERLREAGVPTVVGVDIVEEAAKAVERDRPEVYVDYHVADMTDLSRAERQSLESYRFNGLTCVAALGFGDIPTEAFRTAFNLVEDGGWIAFNIRDVFLQDREPSGFSREIRRMIDDGTLEMLDRHTYVHRHATDGTPLEYDAIIGRKRRDA